MAEEPSDEAKAKEETNRFIILMILSTVIVVFALSHQVTGYGALSSPGTLLEELHGDRNTETLERPWDLGEKAPYRYRPLYRFLVLSAYEFVEQTPEGFYGLFVTASAVCLLLALLAFDWFLRELGFSSKQALTGMALFGLGFPILFAYDFPIHTREDLLGYLWITLMLIAVARDRPWHLAALGVVGVGIRETCLLGVLPFFWVSRRSTQEKVMAYAVPGIAWLTLRAVRHLPGGPTFLETLDGSTRPAREHPFEALLYLFACFGCLWVAAGLRLSDTDRTPTHPLLQTRVVLLAAFATAATGWTLGMAREVRVTYILFPFVVGLALEFFWTPRFRAMLRSRAAWASALAVLALGVGFLTWLWLDPSRVTELRTVFGASFHFGVAPIEQQVFPNGEAAWVELAWASPYNGPFVIAHAAASAFLGCGWLATREAPSPPT